MTVQETIDKNVEALWKEFESVPVDRNVNLRAAWKATQKELIKTRYTNGLTVIIVKDYHI